MSYNFCNYFKVEWNKYTLKWKMGFSGGMTATKEWTDVTPRVRLWHLSQLRARNDFLIASFASRKWTRRRLAIPVAWHSVLVQATTHLTVSSHNHKGTVLYWASEWTCILSAYNATLIEWFPTKAAGEYNMASKWACFLAGALVGSFLCGDKVEWSSSCFATSLDILFVRQ